MHFYGVRIARKAMYFTVGHREKKWGNAPRDPRGALGKRSASSNSATQHAGLMLLLPCGRPCDNYFAAFLYPPCFSRLLSIVKCPKIYSFPTILPNCFRDSDEFRQNSVIIRPQHRCINSIVSAYSLSPPGSPLFPLQVLQHVQSVQNILEL